MKLRNIVFEPVFCASGTRGFFGEGYPYHKSYKKLFKRRFSFEGSTLVSKTTTFEARAGNMPLSQKDKITPTETFPKCIRYNLFSGDALNAVGLSGPGAEYLLNTGRWQNAGENIVISFMAIGQTLAERLHETRNFVNLMFDRKAEFKKAFAIEVNLSCPNVNLKQVDHNAFVEEAWLVLEILAQLGIPIILKFNALVLPHDVLRISQHPSCDAVTISNTLPWGSKIPWLGESDTRQINWNRLFHSGGKSPLLKRGLSQPGGLSGPLLLPIVYRWVQIARAKYFAKPIIAGGGVFSPSDVNLLHTAGASAVFIGTVALFRPWRVQSIIQRAHELWKGR